MCGHALLIMRLCSNVPSSSLLSSPGDRCPKLLLPGEGEQGAPRVGGDGDDSPEKDARPGLSGDIDGEGSSAPFRLSRRSRWWKDRRTCDDGIGTGDATETRSSSASSACSAAALPVSTRTPCEAVPSVASSQDAEDCGTASSMTVSTDTGSRAALGWDSGAAADCC